jgi:hypothetical protein
MDPQTFEAQLNAMFDRGESADHIRTFIANSGYQLAPEDEQHMIDYDAARQSGPTGQKGKVHDAPDTATQTPDGFGAAMLGAGEALTMGALPYAGAVVDTLGGTAGRDNVWNSDKGIMDQFQGNVNANQQMLQGAQTAHPGAYKAGEVAGIAGSIGLPVAAAMRGMRAAAEAPSVAALGRYAAPVLEKEGVEAATGGASRGIMEGPSFNNHVAETLKQGYVTRGNPGLSGPSFNARTAESLAQSTHEAQVERGLGHYQPEFVETMKRPEVRRAMTEDLRKFFQGKPRTTSADKPFEGYSQMTPEAFEELLYRTRNGL